MLVTFISQCEKKAINRTRRILDAFANRIGDNVWQTAITEDGLTTVKKLLRQSATKSTAVSCHRVRTRQRTELVWIVGNRNKFNEVGIVAVNRTKRNILHSEWENNWHYASSIQIIATLSALLHDLGKSTKGFQYKLYHQEMLGDPYRHEWISLKLFELLTLDCKTDNDWLNRLVNIKDWLSNQDIIKQLHQLDTDKINLAKLPPLAQWVAWLIVTHHRLPPLKSVFIKHSEKAFFKESPSAIMDLQKPIEQFYKDIKAVDFWVKNPKTLTEHPKKSQTFWQFQHLVMDSPAWQSQVKRWANKALKDPILMQLSQCHQVDDKQTSISDPFLLYLSRLALMVGDHNYSCIKSSDNRKVKGSSEWREKLVANTDRNTRETNQALDEHLIGVGSFTAHFARHLPIIAEKMPTLKDHDILLRNTGSTRFAWQNQAFNLARSVQEASQDNGFFGINMASTGGGKTIGNARIMYGLSDLDKGARFTIALGLRVLTLQTGLSFRQDLHLSDSQLAILVGGQAHKKLFELNNSDEDKATAITAEIVQDGQQPVFGSESSEELVDEIIDSDIDYQAYADLNIDTLINDAKARGLLFSPIVTCTIDHIIQVSECKRGGRYIAPMLRLLSSDLILDEPDDFDQNDLPALARLVHLAGVFGSRVLLSSATLTPDLMAGLFEAYLAGREIFNQSQNKAKPKVVCAWFDEQPKAITSVACASLDDFTTNHDKFIQKRLKYLGEQPIRRKADILPVQLNYSHEKPERFFTALGNVIVKGATILHERYHITDNTTQKAVSIGLVRIANITNITQLSINLLQHCEIPNDTHIHLACYHAKQVLILRNSLETKLDRILKRKTDDNQTIFTHTEISKALTLSPAKNHIFIVLATPVAEVGRDHDYDWAIVEPSSMRSIIQLAGRVWRHRPDLEATNSNILILQYNLRSLKNNKPAFVYPGFETHKFKPVNYDVTNLIPTCQLEQVDAKPRIQSDKNLSVTAPINSLSQLEHSVMAYLMHNPKTNYVNAYWRPTATANRVHTHLQQITPFRDDSTLPQEDWLIIPKQLPTLDNLESDIDKSSLANPAEFDAYIAEDVYTNTLKNATAHNKRIVPMALPTCQAGISPWLASDLMTELQAIQLKMPDKSINSLAISFCHVSLDKESSRNSRNWRFNEFLGFMQ